MLRNYVCGIYDEKGDLQDTRGKSEGSSINPSVLIKIRHVFNFNFQRKTATIRGLTVFL